MTPTRPLLYQAFGLRIRSTLPLWPDPLRLSTPDDADVEVVISDDLSCEATAISLGASEMATHIDGIGALRVASGERR